MSFIPYAPDIKIFTKYFTDQVEISRGKSNQGGKKMIYSDVGGGATLVDGFETKLSPIGKAHQQNTKENDVVVSMTSPAEATVQQAKAELRHTKDNTEQMPVIYTRVTKREASHGNKPKNKKKKKENKSNKKARKHKDIFS